MSTEKPKFGYAFGTGATILVLILDFLVILSSVSNCIVYNKIVSGEPNSDISVGWGRFMLGVNIVVAIFAFIIFFWILYILFTGKKSIGDELTKKRDKGGLKGYLGYLSEDVKSRLAGNYMKQGMSASDAVASADAVVNAASKGNPSAAAAVNAVVSGVPPNTVRGLFNAIERDTDYGPGSWNMYMSSESYGGNCSSPLNTGCSAKLECSDGSTNLPCPGISPTGNDLAINKLYAAWKADSKDL
jgi:hypothetical protein